MIAFRVILADPPWRYANFSAAAHGAAAAHYDGMTEEAMAAIPVASWAAPDAAIFMWATWPKLDEAMRLISAWGFDYVTAVPWVKTLPAQRAIYRGIGFWAMAAAEVLLIARRGDPGRQKVDPVIGLLEGEPRVFYAPRTRHSAKPLEVHEWIEGMFPGGPFLELFARQERPGWTTYGNELGFRLSAAGVEPCERPVRERDAMPLFDAYQARVRQTGVPLPGDRRE